VEGYQISIEGIAIMRVNRLEFLQQLESVSPGLSTRDILEQTSCFVFEDGMVKTFNDEVACFHPTALKTFKGSVIAAPLLAVLRKMDEEELDLSEGTKEGGEGELVISGKRRGFAVRMDSEISLPLNLVETPGKNWSPLHPDFGEAIQRVQQCASNDLSTYKLTCVHITPKYMEATDNYHIIRYKIKSGVTEPTLIRRTSIKHLVHLGMGEFNMTETWAHFRNSNGLRLSCRRTVEEYCDGTATLAQTGSPMTLPKGLAEAVEKAHVFSSENVDDDQILIDLRPGKLRIKSEGNSGRYWEIKKLKYDGPELSFRIAPAMLKDLCNQHNECEITSDILKVNGGKFVYVTTLGVVEQEEAATKEVDKPKSKSKK
jgi:hypothetical protein